MSPVPRDIGEQTPGPASEIPDPLPIANRYRYAPTSDLAHLDPEALLTAARRLRAAAYSLTTAARRFEHRAALLTHQATHPEEGPT